MTTRYGKNDMVRVTGNTSMHGFKEDDIVAIIGTKVRPNGSHFYQAVNADGDMWGLTDDDIMMFEKGGLLRVDAGEKVLVV